MPSVMVIVVGRLAACVNRSSRNSVSKEEIDFTSYGAGRFSNGRCSSSKQSLHFGSGIIETCGLNDCHVQRSAIGSGIAICYSKGIGA